MSEKKPKLRFKREPEETGCGRSYLPRPRGYELWYDNQAVGFARPLRKNWPIPNVTGYYWYCETNSVLGIRLKNTASEPAPTMEDAKTALKAYVEDCLKAKGLRR